MSAAATCQNLQAGSACASLSYVAGGGSIGCSAYMNCPVPNTPCNCVRNAHHFCCAPRRLKQRLAHIAFVTSFRNSCDALHKTPQKTRRPKLFRPVLASAVHAHMQRPWVRHAAALRPHRAAARSMALQRAPAHLLMTAAGSGGAATARMSDSQPKLERKPKGRQAPHACLAAHGTVSMTCRCYSLQQPAGTRAAWASEAAAAGGTALSSTLADSLSGR
jgi:hypothetical protein